MKKDVNELISGLSDEDIGKRRISAQTIGKIGKEDPLKIKDVIPKLIRTLNDDDSYIRATIAKVLGDIGLKEPNLVKIAVSELITKTSDKYVEVQENALYALETIGAQSPYLPHLAANKFLDLLRTQYLQEDEEDISDFQLLAKQMEIEDTWTRYFTIGAIVDYLQQNDEEVNEVKMILNKALESNDFWMRKGGLWALCHLWARDILEDDALPIVKSGLHEDSPEVRLSAINCINIILQKQNERVDELTPLLLELFNDKENRIRELAYNYVIDIYENYPHTEKDIISKLIQLKRETKQKETVHLIARTLEYIAKPKIKELMLKKKGRYPLSKIAKKHMVSESFVKIFVQKLSLEGMNVEVVNENELLEDFLRSLNSEEEKTIRKFLKLLSKEQQIDLNELMANIFSEEQLKRVINKMQASHWIKGEIQEEKKFIRKDMFFVGSVVKPRDLIIAKK